MVRVEMELPGLTPFPQQMRQSRVLTTGATGNESRDSLASVESFRVLGPCPVHDLVDG